MEPRALNRSVGEKYAKPLYVQIKEYVLKQIQNGSLQEGDRVPSESELARCFSVSRITSRQALTELVNDGYLYRIRGKGTFVKKTNPFAESPGKSGALISHKTLTSQKTVGLMGPLVTDYPISEMIIGTESVLKSEGYDLLLVNSENDPKVEKENLEQLTENKACGVILWSAEYSQASSLVRHLVRSNYPLVLVDRYFPGIETAFVGCDNFGGAYLATKHLISLGHRRIAFVTTPNIHVTTVRDRLRGYEHALRLSGLAFTRDLVFNTFPLEYLFSEQVENEDEIKEYLDKAQPTAILTVNDLVAIYLLRAFQQIGIRVPEELAVVGFDGRDICASLHVPLTTVAQPAREIGMSAAHLLLDLIRGKHSDMKQIVLPTRLIVRDSCGMKLAV